MLDIGKGLEEGGRTPATRGKVIAAAPGTKLQDESNPGAAKVADVQRSLDGKPAVFRSHAEELQRTGVGVIAAARRHDVKQLSVMAGSLDEVCESGHVVSWYPNQKR